MYIDESCIKFSLFHCNFRLVKNSEQLGCDSVILHAYAFNTCIQRSDDMVVILMCCYQILWVFLLK